MDGVDEVRLEELPNSGDSASEPNVLALGGVLGSSQRLRGRRVEEVERGVGKREAGSLMVGEDEHGGVEGRVVSPPSLPIEVLPRAALRSELVAAHDLGPDAGIVEPHASPHDLRHTFCDESINAGVDPKMVAWQLGHKDERTLIDHYTHGALPPGAARCAEIVEELIAGGGVPWTFV